ncbi:MAG TPA: hypothetical protein VJ045_01035 [Hyphomicrobiaceae bacterium]|nr:hypothetical protein [Hyphomicrobiaceae bacterium]
MSVDVVLRAIGTLTCMYTVGLFVTVLSLATVNAASYAAGPPCGPVGCQVAAYHQRFEPTAAPAEPHFLGTAAILLAENI